MLKQKFLIDFGAKFSIYLFTALTGIIVARIAGPQVVGTISYATSYVSIFLFITGLFGTGYIKIVSEGENEADSFATYSWLFGFSLFIYFIIVLGFYLYQKFLLGYKFENHDVELVIIITLCATVIGNLYQFCQTIFIARIEQAKANLPNFLKAIIYNLLRIMVVISGMGAIALASVNLLSALLVLPLVIFLFHKIKFGKFCNKLAKRIYSISIPFFLINIVQSLMMYSDKLILGHFASAKEIGLYTTAYSIGGMLILLGNTAGTVFFPLFSSFFTRNEFDQVKKRIYQFERFIFNFILPVIITLSLFAYPVLITLLGRRYELSVPIFSLLVFSSFFIIWGMPYGNVLSGLGLFWLSTFIYFVQFAIFLITLIIFIHPHLFNLGALALAITQVVINLYLFISFYYSAWKKIKVHFIKRQIKYIFMGVIIYYVSYFFLLPTIKTISIYIQSFIIAPVFLLIYYLIEYFLGLLNKSDLQMLLQLIDPKLSLKYVNEEFKNHSHNEPSSGL